MSFEVFAQSGENQGRVLPSHAAFLSVFGGALYCDDGKCLSLVYDSDSCDIYYSLDESGETVVGFMIARPIADVGLWNSVFALLARYHFYLIWPGDCGPVVGRSDIALPDGLADEIGQPIVVQAAQEIPLLIESS